MKAFLLDYCLHAVMQQWMSFLCCNTCFLFSIFQLILSRFYSTKYHHKFLSFSVPLCNPQKKYAVEWCFVMFEYLFDADGVTLYLFQTLGLSFSFFQKVNSVSRKNIRT